MCFDSTVLGFQISRAPPCLFSQSLMGNYDVSVCPWVSEASGGYSSSSKALIFSLRNKEGLEPFKSMVKYADYAIFSDLRYGPRLCGGPAFLIASTGVMLKATGIHTQTLVALTIYQVQHKKVPKSWLSLFNSRLVTGKYSTLPKSHTFFVLVTRSFPAR